MKKEWKQGRAVRENHQVLSYDLIGWDKGYIVNLEVREDISHNGKWLAYLCIDAPKNDYFYKMFSTKVEKFDTEEEAKKWCIKTFNAKLGKYRGYVSELSDSVSRMSDLDLGV